MSRSRNEMAEVECPACGQRFHVEVWLVVDHAERPDLVRLLMEGELNAAACPRCGAEGGLNYPLLFHDGSRRLLLCAVPLTVQGPHAVRELVGDLLNGLVEAIPVDERVPYLREVELVAELDGLRSALLEQVGVDEREVDERSLASAIEALLNAAGQVDFQRVIAEQRQVLLTDRAEQALDVVNQNARATGDRELQRRAREAKALLARLRSIVFQRRKALATLLDGLAPLEASEALVLPELKRMLEAIDPQEVYAARITLDVDEQATLDSLVERLAERAEAEHQPEALTFIQRLRALPGQ